MTQLYLFVFKLQEDKYFIGYSADYERAFVELRAGFGLPWTTKYRPVSIDLVLEDSDGVNEKGVLYKYFKIYGIDNVRGGPYTDMELSTTQRETIQSLIQQEDEDLIAVVEKLSI